MLRTGIQAWSFKCFNGGSIGVLGVGANFMKIRIPEKNGEGTARRRGNFHNSSLVHFLWVPNTSGRK